MVQQIVEAAVVVKRMCDLLQSFPAAAISGVQWQTLVRKYEERHSTKLDVKSLGFSSPLVAATSLFWDVLRIIDAEDSDNPVVAVEDNVALTPQPGFLACWPSLYVAFCVIVSQHGSQETSENGTRSNSPRGLLLSKLKPFLQTHWHPNFCETGVSYLSEEGTGVQVKKMKHLVTAVLRWRGQKVDWLGACAGRGILHEALAPELELVPSKNRNDLVLRFKFDTAILGMIPQYRESLLPRIQSKPQPSVTFDKHSRCLNAEVDSNFEDGSPRASSSSDASVSAGMEREIAMLQAENASLRKENQLLEQHSQALAKFHANALCGVLLAPFFHTPVKPSHCTELYVGRSLRTSTRGGDVWTRPRRFSARQLIDIGHWRTRFQLWEFDASIRNDIGHHHANQHRLRSISASCGL